MDDKKDTNRKIIENTRFALLDLHKLLVDTARADYEKTHDPIKSPWDWVSLLMTDKFFAWLHPFSKLITSIDELLELTWPISQMDATAVRAEVENLISDFPTTPVEFRSHYLAVMQREPTVVIAHAKVKKEIELLPEPDPKKISDLLQVRRQWTAAHQMKHFNPKNSKPS